MKRETGCKGSETGGSRPLLVNTEGAERTEWEPPTYRKVIGASVRIVLIERMRGSSSSCGEHTSGLGPTEDGVEV